MLLAGRLHRVVHDIGRCVLVKGQQASAFVIDDETNSLDQRVAGAVNVSGANEFRYGPVPVLDVEPGFHLA